MGKNEGVVDTFASRFAVVRSVYGPLAWGLDPSGATLDAWGLGDTPDGLDRFADLALSAAVGTVGVVKLQAAFYAAAGWRGFRTLQRLIADGRRARLLVIVDAKRGDVGTTNDAYAEAFLGKDAPLGADALTVHPYLGLGAMEPFVDAVRMKPEAACSGGHALLESRRQSRPVGAHGVRSERGGVVARRDRRAQRGPGARSDRAHRGCDRSDALRAGARFGRRRGPVPRPRRRRSGCHIRRRGPGVRQLSRPGHSERLSFTAQRRPRRGATAPHRPRPGRRVRPGPLRLDRS